MPAPNIATLFDYESAYEDAAAAYFSNLNGNPFNQVLTPRTVANANANTAYLMTPRLAIRAGITGTLFQEESNNNSNYYANRQGTLVLDVVTRRNASGQNHGLLRGKVREAMLSQSVIFNSNSVPYFQTIDLIEATSTQLIDAENDEIMTQIVYALEFFIPPASWPNS